MDNAAIAPAEWPEQFDHTIFAKDSPDINAALRAAGENRRNGRSTRIIAMDGVYREPVIFDGAEYGDDENVPFIALEAAENGRAVLSGAVPVSGWERRSRLWTAPLPEEAAFHLTRRGGEYFPKGHAPNPWPGDVDDRAGLFCNGLILSGGVLYYPVKDESRLAPGAFAADCETGKITLSPLYGFSPEDAEIAAKHSLLIIKNTKNFILRGFVVTGAGWAQGSAAGVSQGENILVEGCSFSRNRYGGFSTHRVKNCLFQDIDMIDNGAVGGGGSWRGYIRNCVFRRLRVVNNNWIGEKFGWTDYDPCGVKWAAMRDVLVEDCDFSFNRGEGLWFDTENRRVTVRGCRMAGNLNSGVMLEANMGPFQISGCEIYGNRKGVFIAATEGVTLEKCHIHDNKYAVDVYDHSSKNDKASGRGPHKERPADFANIDDGGFWESHSVNTAVKECVIASHPRFSNPVYTHNSYGEGWGNDERGFVNFAASLTASGNRYFHPKPETAFILKGAEECSLEEWKKHSGQDHGSVMNGGSV